MANDQPGNVIESPVQPHPKRRSANQRTLWAKEGPSRTEWYGSGRTLPSL